jgi:hypothetical protein
MKTVVSVNEVAELEIKPQAELEQWKQLVKKEIESRWNKPEAMFEVSCPVCNSKKQTDAFDKNGFHYVECTECRTIFSKNRPDSAALYDWYTQSASVKFWQEKLLKLSAESRKAKIIEPRAHWILDGVSEYVQHAIGKKIQLTDISFFGGALADTLDELSDDITITSAGILAGKEQYASKRVTVKPLASIDHPGTLDKTDVLVAIDVLDRIQNIKAFFAELENVINPEGIFFATCPVSSGFEIQSLWDRSPSVIPPDKLNLPSVQGLIDLFSRSSKWEILELSTPGMFDVESVRQEMKKHGDVAWPRSLHALLDNINNQGAGLFTEYLQSQRLSSFARLVVRRTGSKIY